MTKQQNETVEHFKRSFLPQLEAYAAKLRHEFPDLWINVDSDPVGSLTSYQAHDVYIDCIFPDAPDDQPDNIALSITVKHLTTEPRLCVAGVGWGSGAVEIDLLEESVPYSAEAVADISKKLPMAFAKLRSAIKRGRPDR